MLLHLVRVHVLRWVIVNIILTLIKNYVRKSLESSKSQTSFCKYFKMNKPMKNTPKKVLI